MNIDNELINQIKITPILDSLKLEDISDEEYFSKKYSNYISNSRLGQLKTKGVKAFFEWDTSNQDYNPSFQFGSWLHQLVLQPESFEVIKGVHPPTAKAGLMALELYHKDGSTPTDDEIKAASYKIGYYKDKLTSSRISELRTKCNEFWRDKFLYESNNPFKEGDKERLFVDEKSYILLTECIKSIAENKEINKILNPNCAIEKPYIGYEQTILLDVEIKIPDYEPKVYKLKSKLDNFIINKEDNVITVNDLKTTSKLAKEFDHTFFSYQRELGMYSYLLKLCAKKFFDVDSPKIKGNFLVVSVIPEYNSLVYPMTPKLFKQGFEEFKYLLKTAAYFNIVKGYEI
jgi:hypothetical protein